MTLIEAWDHVRRRHGDEIAQQAFVNTWGIYGCWEKGPGKVRHFFGEVNGLLKRQYTDGMDSYRHKVQGKQRIIIAQQFHTDYESLTPGSSSDPETIVMKREEVRNWPLFRFRVLPKVEFSKLAMIDGRVIPKPQKPRGRPRKYLTNRI